MTTGRMVMMRSIGYISEIKEKKKKKADHEQDWQPYPIDPYSAIYDDHTYT